WTAYPESAAIMPSITRGAFAFHNAKAATRCSASRCKAYDGYLLSADVPDDRQDAPLNVTVRRIDVNRLHRRVFGLQANAVVFMEEALERRLAALVQPDRHHVAVFGIVLLAEDDNVAVADHGVDHRVALHAQREDLRRVRAAEQPDRHV